MNDWSNITSQLWLGQSARTAAAVASVDRMVTKRADAALESFRDEVEAADATYAGKPCGFGTAGAPCGAPSNWVVAHCCDRAHLTMTPACELHGQAQERLDASGYEATCPTCRRSCAAGFIVPGWREAAAAEAAAAAAADNEESP